MGRGFASVTSAPPAVAPATQPARRSTLQPSRPRSIGLAVHTDASAVADVAQDHGAAVLSLGPSGTRHPDIAPCPRQRPSTATQLVLVSEAGPCGSWLSRSLRNHGSACWGVAPALSPKTAGDRVQTARRDAGHLARLRRAGERTPVDVPQVEEAALRERCRAREATMGALQAAKLRRIAFWLRHAKCFQKGFAVK